MNIIRGLRNSLFTRMIARKKAQYTQVSIEQATRIQNTITRGEGSSIILTGKHSYCLDNIQIRSWGEGAHLFIGSFCSIAGNLKVYLGGNHRIDWATTFPFGHIYNDIFPSGTIRGKDHPSTNGHVIIENDVWIGDNCTIMSGLRIGSGSVIAANSVVVRNVEPYSIVGGNPARLIKKRFDEGIIERLLKVNWWDWEDSEIDSIVPILQQPLTDLTLNELESLGEALPASRQNSQ